MATRLDAAPILAGEEERGMANFLEYNPEQASFQAIPHSLQKTPGGGYPASGMSLVPHYQLSGSVLIWLLIAQDR